MKSLSDVNEASYKTFCPSKGKIPEPQKLPSTSDELLQHCKCIFFVTCTVKLALEENPGIPWPQGYGWEITADGGLKVAWMTQSQHQIPFEIVLLVTAKNKRRTENCFWASHGLKCNEDFFKDRYEKTAEED